jgi:zinc protease
VAAAAPITTRAWPQAGSDIAPDTAATYGSLPNGMRYIIYPNSEPPKRLSLRLHIAAGSLMEADDQQGVAHFLEHMVFNGSKSYTAAELIPRMQRLGIAFGAHVNAYTSFDETVYMLDLPDLSEETMKLGFTIMRDFGDGALLQPAEIENERGVILAEKISRDTVGYRLMHQQLNTLLPKSLITQRFPIGIEAVIKTAPRERFADFYTRYYTPARMTFIVVGDVNAVDMAKRIETLFGSMTNPPEPGKNPELGAIKSPEGLAAAVFADKEVSATSLSLTVVRPFVPKPDTAANRNAQMPLEIAHSMLSRRLERASKKEKSPIAEGSASRSELFNYAELGSIDVTAADDRWQDAVPVLEQEFRRAFEHGFTDGELAEAKSNILNAYEQAVKQKSTRKSDGLAMVFVKSINNNSVFSTPETDLEIAVKGLEAVTPAACHAAFKTFWEATGMHLILTTKVKPDKAEQELAALYQESTGVPVEAPAATSQQAFAYQDFGKPGTVASRKEVEDLGITQLVLSNNIRINLKPTDFEKNRIHLSARIGSGQLTQPKDTPMLDEFATAVFEGGGLGKHSNDELQQILAGKTVGSGLGIEEDAFTLGGSTTPAEFGLQVRLMCASLTDPGYRNEGLWQFQKAIPMIYQQLNHTPAGPQQAMMGWLHGGDPRFSPAPMEKLSSYTIDDAKKWLTPELTKGYLELSIVGDFQMDAVLPELLATFGALPKREATKPPLADARKVLFPNAPAEKTFTYQSKIPQAVAFTIWKTAGLRNNQKEFRRLNLLAEIYQDRLREEIREKLGASYSPNGAATGSDALEGYGFILGQAVGKVPDVPLLLKTMRELADQLAIKGVSADDLDRAIKPTLSQIEKAKRDNKYWLGTVMAQSQLDPKRLDLIRGRDADLKSITAAEINALAKKYLKAENALLIGIKPQDVGSKPQE